jgi:hypothetical protein
MPLRKLTPLDFRRFQAAYVSNGHNGMRAYLVIRPKVSDGHAKAEASRILSKPEVQAAIREIEENDLVELNITRKRTLQEAASIAYLDLRRPPKKEYLKTLSDVGGQKLRALEILCKAQKIFLADTTMPEESGEEHIHFYIPQNKRFKVTIKQND